MKKLSIGIILSVGLLTCSQVERNNPFDSGSPKYKLPNSPLVPINLVATPMSYNSINVNWNASPGATGYRVARDRNVTGIFQFMRDVYSSQFVDTDSLLAATVYFYKVSAFGQGGASSFCMPVMVETPIDPARTLPAPTITSAIRISPTEIDIVWTFVTNAGVYRLFRSDTDSNDYVLIVELPGTQFANVNLPAGRKFFYKVSAHNLATQYNSTKSFAIAVP
jgi:fibronectin type 3 domain-containing protein